MEMTGLPVWIPISKEISGSRWVWFSQGGALFDSLTVEQNIRLPMDFSRIGPVIKNWKE